MPTTAAVHAALGGLGYEHVDTGEATAFLVPIDPDVAALEQGALPVEVRIDEAAELVSFATPLASVEDPPAALLASLLRRHWYAEQTGGLSYALRVVGDGDVLSAVWHLPLAAVDSSGGLGALLDTFVAGALDCIAEVAASAEADASIEAVHPIG
ncbi:MAG: hypothetical protein ACRD0G_04735 [Acidimicrobiales bacterium]